MVAAEPGRVLVVDDEPVVSSMLCDVLATVGYVVASAASGEKALNLVPTFNPSVVLKPFSLALMRTAVRAAIATGSRG